MSNLLIIPVQNSSMAKKKIFVAGSTRKAYYRTINVKKK
jgi:hypothetical protein